MLTKLAGHSNLEKTFQRASRLMESKALVKSMKAMNSSWFCFRHFYLICRATKIISVLPRDGLKSHWVSGSIYSVSGSRLYRRTRASIFPAMDSRAMPR